MAYLKDIIARFVCMSCPVHLNIFVRPLRQLAFRDNLAILHLGCDFRCVYQILFSKRLIGILLLSNVTFQLRSNLLKITLSGRPFSYVVQKKVAEPISQIYDKLYDKKVLGNIGDPVSRKCDLVSWKCDSVSLECDRLSQKGNLAPPPLLSENQVTFTELGLIFGETRSHIQETRSHFWKTRSQFQDHNSLLRETWSIWVNQVIFSGTWVTFSGDWQ